MSDQERREPEQQADELEQRGKGLDEAIDETRQEWEARKSDDAVPGAVPDDEDHGDLDAGGAASFPGKGDSGAPSGE